MQVRARIRAFAVILALTTLALAPSDSTADLKARADSAHGGEQAKLCLEYAHRMLQDANDLFTKGDVDKAQEDIRQIVEYARKGADAASSSGKRQKQTEIALRELSKHMHDIGDTLAFEDRGPVRRAVEEIEQTRSDLLSKMFQK